MAERRRGRWGRDTVDVPSDRFGGKPEAFPQAAQSSGGEVMKTLLHDSTPPSTSQDFLRSPSGWRTPPRRHRGPSS